MAIQISRCEAGFPRGDVATSLFAALADLGDLAVVAALGVAQGESPDGLGRVQPVSAGPDDARKRQLGLGEETEASRGRSRSRDVRENKRRRHHGGGTDHVAPAEPAPKQVLLGAVIRGRHSAAHFAHPSELHTSKTAGEGKSSVCPPGYLKRSATQLSEN